MQPESSVDGFLRSLGLEKYSITFQVEEVRLFGFNMPSVAIYLFLCLYSCNMMPQQVDMTALLHMTDEDLKALGVPMVMLTPLRISVCCIYQYLSL